MSSVPKGHRKAQAAFRSGLVLLLGFAIACWLKPPTEVFSVFVAGVVGNATSFVWGNTKEWQSQKGGQ